MEQDLFQTQAEARPGEGASGGRFARVVVERGIEGDAAAEGLTYRLEQEAGVGQRVEVPLGRGNKPSGGIVVAVGGEELLEGFDARRVKAVLRVSEARLPPELIRLARWMAQYYVCPLGMVLMTMLPAAVKRATGQRRRTELERAGAEEEGRILGSAQLPPATGKAWEAITELGPKELPAPARWIAQRTKSPSVAPINRLVKLGLLREVQRTYHAGAAAAWEGLSVEAAGAERQITPTEAQSRVVEGVRGTLGEFRVHLLRGVTGSGKTEVYLRVMQRVIERGESALMLVPEISLTPQTAGRILRRFADVAVLHSGLTASQRNRQWALAASGSCKVVVGARSAVFAPLPNLGLIVVDEEHASDYKQDQLPRYHARDVAIKRAQIHGCPVLLGSATPSLESWANANGETAGLPKGQTRSAERPTSRGYRLWELPERVGGGRLPRVRIVDLAQERRSGGGERLLGRALESALARTLEEGGQAILLLNRRGFANYIGCPSPSCGWVLTCADCDATMVLHKGRSLPRGALVRCHHCLAEQLVPSVCPLCARPTQVPRGVLGMGTQRLEEELARMFPFLGPGQMLRLDSDTMATARDYFEALSAFAAGRARVLLGTQMIAKGLDYPNVRLVGVVNADTALAIPDFRASERAFQLVSQVAGRTGRGSEPGLVIVQTMAPNSPAIQLAARHDYVSFATRELEARRAAGLPPSTRMARIVLRDEDLSRAEGRAQALARALREGAEDWGRGRSVRVMGPMPAPIARIAGQHRIAIEMTAPTANDLLRPLKAARAAGLVKSDAHTAVDVDPVALL